MGRSSGKTACLAGIPLDQLRKAIEDHCEQLAVVLSRALYKKEESTLEGETEPTVVSSWDVPVAENSVQAIMLGSY